MRKETYLQAQIDEHYQIINHLRMISTNHPELFERTIKRHLRDIENLKKQLNNISPL